MMKVREVGCRDRVYVVSRVSRMRRHVGVFLCKDSVLDAGLRLRCHQPPGRMNRMEVMVRLGVVRGCAEAQLA